MKKLLTLWLLAISLAAAAQSQHRIFCGNEYLPDLTEQHHPGYKDAVQQAFDRAKNHSASRATNAVTYTIPIIFHVVYGTAAENLDDSILQSEIDVLNADYSRTNADAINTISYFDSVGADTHIQFTLHSTVRVQTSNQFTLDLFTGLPDSLIKFSAAGGDDAIDPDHYLNIWVVNLQPSLFGQLLGYSYPPDGLPNWPTGQSSAAPQPGYDGVVLDYRTVGANNPNPINFSGMNLVIRGRTGTHEIGHYLGLRHIWGDGATFGTNDCQQSDGIDDTPFANTQSNFDCDTTRNTCSQIEAYYGANAPDMVQNYMDYSSEECMNLFTKGQAALMQNTLEINRPMLATKSYPLAVSEAAATTVAVYPNPTTGIVYVRSAESTDAATTVVVYNMLGETMGVNMVTQAGALKLDISSLAGGVYTIDIVKNGAHTTKKVVLSK
ncbi:MAG: T9SS type A sorting domain-containing protein [Bacteroidetes bacterium]|nr:T9SS type A sorting domain-containing protein [Bacteroidota bacterium]